MPQEPVHMKDVDFVPVIFFQETLNYNRTYGQLVRWTRIDDYSALLYFDVIGGQIPEVLVIRYFDKYDWELVTLSRFTRRELGKET